MKNLTTTLIAIILLGNFGFSQDIIKLKTGLEIKAKIIEVGVKEVKYKKFDFLEGPNYVVRKKTIEFIKYENGEKNTFYENLKTNSIEYKALCERKIKFFRKQKDIGLFAAGAGIIGTTILYIDYNKWNKTSASHLQPEKAAYYFTGTYFTSAVAITGVVLAIIGNNKVNDYSKKLKNINVGVNLSQKQKVVSLSYRF